MVDSAIGETGDTDTAAVVLPFENDVIGIIDNSRQVLRGYHQRVEVLGAEGCISTGSNYPNMAIVGGRQTVHRDLPLRSCAERHADSYLAEKQVSIDFIEHDTPPPVTGWDGLIPSAMGYAARKSIDENRPVGACEVAPGSQSRFAFEIDTQRQHDVGRSSERLWRL